MVLVMPLCAITVEVLAHIRKLLNRPAPFPEPTVRNFWRYAECCLIEYKERIALDYAFAYQASEFFLKRFCAALFAL